MFPGSWCARYVTIWKRGAPPPPLNDHIFRFSRFLLQVNHLNVITWQALTYDPHATGAPCVLRCWTPIIRRIVNNGFMDRFQLFHLLRLSRWWLLSKFDDWFWVSVLMLLLLGIALSRSPFSLGLEGALSFSDSLQSAQPLATGRPFDVVDPWQ